jgi:UDP-N-acetylglucosamine acyltransferase
METTIHPTAIVDPKAALGAGVEIGPYAIIEANVEIGDGTVIGPHALVAWGTRMGSRCRVHHAATVGTIPQDLKFAGEESYCLIGDDTIIREYVSINRGTAAAGKTVVGSHCAILAYCHVGHDCIVGDHFIVSNNLAMAGHVIVGNHVTVGGVCAFHQFVRIGDHVMIGASSYVTQDVVPFAITGIEPVRVAGINKVGLERRGFSADRRQDIKRAYKILFREGLSIDDACGKMVEQFAENPDVRQIVDFVKSSKRGILRMRESDLDD